MHIVQATLAAFLVYLPNKCASVCTEVLPFWCDDETCIGRYDFCNGSAECPNGRDETKYDISKHAGTDDLECRNPFNNINYTCLLPAVYRCDHEIDCVGGKDECGCKSTFYCDNDECALKVQFCDGSIDCSDGTDELPYNRSVGGFQCQVTKKHLTLRCVLPDIHVCDGDSECEWGTDECFCDFSAGAKGTEIKNAFSNDKCFRCLDGSLVIPNNQVCDGMVHCQDLSDECLCKERNMNKNSTIMCKDVCLDDSCGCPGQLMCSPGAKNISEENREKVCLDPTSICDDKYDCANGYDEDFCANEEGFFSCSDGSKRVHKNVICDGINDCPDSSDEYRCHEDKFICSFHKDIYFWPYLKELNVTENFPRINRTRIENSLFGYRFYWPYYTDACDGIPLCTNSEDECNSTLCPGPLPGFCQEFKENKCPNSESVLTGYEVCDGQPTCNDTAPETSADEWGCPKRFYCKNYGATRLPIHLPEQNKCDGKAECDDQSDELECGSDTHFYCNDGGSTLFIPIEQKCDKRKDCKEGSDECANCEVSPFSSDEKLIKSRVLIVFLWVIGLVATLGNSAIVINQVVNINRTRSESNQVALKNRILVLNLACADLVTGIYLIILGIKDAIVDRYCLMDQEWRSGSTCSGLGTIAVISTEASIMILVLMTSHRLYLIFHPFKSQKTWTVTLSALCAWIIAIILGTAPLSLSARNYFLSCVWFRNHRYLGYACKDEITAFTKKLVAFEGPDRLFSKTVGSEYTWQSMLAAQKVLNDTYEPERYFGYYSAHSVCLPRLFPNRLDDQSWGYSLFLVLLNFFSFVFILIGYIVIYKRSTANNMASHKEDRAAALQRKITRIVLTDFCCWMPICIMAFITVSGIDVGDIAYAVTAIILLPINSAMNPFLYSSLLDIIWDYLKPARDWVEQTWCGKTVSEGVRGSFKKNRRKSSSMATTVTNVPTYTIGGDNSGESTVNTGKDKNEVVTMNDLKTRNEE